MNVFREKDVIQPVDIISPARPNVYENSFLRQEIFQPKQLWFCISLKNIFPIETDKFFIKTTFINSRRNEPKILCKSIVGINHAVNFSKLQNYDIYTDFR